MKKSAHKGFTLIELLVVIAIVGVLAAVVLIAINPARRLGQGRDSGRKSDIGQLATAAQAYFTSNSSYSLTLAALVTSGDLKTEPQPAAPDTGAAGYDYAVIPVGCDVVTTSCDEMAIFETLEQPTVVGGAYYWCYRSATGKAEEVLISTGCAP